MNYSIINDCDFTNGEGVRVSIFVSGCNHHCKGCFNEKTWDFNYGKVFTLQEENNIINLLNKNYITGFSILGGEPLDLKNISCILNLCKRIKKEFPQKDIWCWTGFLYGELISRDDTTRELLNYIDVLVDGKFILELRDVSLQFRGSLNQRIIDVRKSLIHNKITIR